MEDLAYQLKQFSEQLEEMNGFYTEQMTYNPNFQGRMADAYRQNLKELSEQHKKLIQLYQALYKELIEIIKDYEDIESSLLNRIQNL